MSVITFVNNENLYTSWPVYNTCVLHSLMRAYWECIEQ